MKAATDVIAFGASAISDIGGLYTQNVQALPKYYAALYRNQLPVERGILLSEDDRRRRRVITELMCNFWVDLGADAPLFETELEELRRLEAEGLLGLRGSEVELTPLGRVFVRNVAMVFDAYLPRSAPLTGFSRAV